MQVPCGRCRLCRKKLANEWLVRLYNEFAGTPTHLHNGKIQPRVAFVTLTFAEKYYTDNDAIFAEYLVRFRDNYRKRYGKSPRYWAVTDRGAKYGRLHLHMFIFNPYDYKNNCPISLSHLSKEHFWWKYGFVHGVWLNKSYAGAIYAVGYITMSNLDKDAKKHGITMCEKAQRHKPHVYPSKGIGKSYDTLHNRDIYRNGDRFVRLGQFQYGLPRYYRYKWTSKYERWVERKEYELQREDDYICSNIDIELARYHFLTLVEWEQAVQNHTFPATHTFELAHKHYSQRILQMQIADLRKYDALSATSDVVSVSHHTQAEVSQSSACSVAPMIGSPHGQIIHTIPINYDFEFRPWENKWFPYGDLTNLTIFPF